MKEFIFLLIGAGLIGLAIAILRAFHNDNNSDHFDDWLNGI